MGTSPGKLICRRHYGFSWGLLFREGIDNEADAYWSFGEKYCRGWMKWVINKVSTRCSTVHETAITLKPSVHLANLRQGDEIDVSTHRTVGFSQAWQTSNSSLPTIILYSCTADEAPQRDDCPGMSQAIVNTDRWTLTILIGITAVGLIRMDISGVKMSRFRSQRTAAGTSYEVQYELKVDMRTEDGVLKYTCIADGKTVGITTIDFRE